MHLRARHVSDHLFKRETRTKVGSFGGAACFGSGKGCDEEGNRELHCDEMTWRVIIRGFFQRIMNEFRTWIIVIADLSKGDRRTYFVPASLLS